MRWCAAIMLCLVATLAVGQESWLQADFRRESERVSDACKSFKVTALGGCAYELFSDHPLHIAAGSMPPQNGFALGGAFGEQRNTGTWRLSFDVDAVGSFSGAWRAGGYMTMMHTPIERRHVVEPVMAHPGSNAEARDMARKPPTNFVHPYTTVSIYAQTISLNKLNYFGEGNNTTLADASLFGMTQTIIGGNVVKPVYEVPSIRKLNLGLLGELNGRFVSIKGEQSSSIPSIDNLYVNATAPGLSSQPGFAQLGEGFRIKPVFANRFELNYMGKFQQFFAPSSSQNSFLRWTADLNHTFYLYGYTKSAPMSTGADGPDECSRGEEKCPEVAHSRNLTDNLNGSVSFRLLLSESINSATSAVPFYFQQTLGGSDIDSAMSLPSYQDYRFRAPNLLLLQETFEHSIWGPFGFKFAADQGRVALTRSDIGFSDMKHSFAAGLTLRAGGFPMVSLMFAWGGTEGHHNIFNMNNSLLGGSTRPLLD
jgi:hypothetical protein